MKHLALPATALLLAVLSVTVYAQSSSDRLDFDHVDLSRYSDAPFADEDIDLAVSVLTEEGVLQGNDPSAGSGQAPTFMPNRNLNRAEFVQIIMRLLNDTGTVNKNCFPDVSPTVWYADPVCRAKALGIVRGNAVVGVPENLWRFEPTRDVQYEEAVKMLVELYALPINGDGEGMDWYVPYINAAADARVDLVGLDPGDRITRGEMAQLTIAFLAHSRGQLEELRDAEDANDQASSSSSRSSSSRTSSTASSHTSSVSSFQTDPLTDLTVRSNFLVLGETSPVIGAVNFFADDEAIDVTDITIRLISDNTDIRSLWIYEESNGRLIGTATRESAGVYSTSVPEGRLVLPHNQDKGIYVRALLKDTDSGGQGGQIVRIDEIEIEGEGQSSNDDYTVSSSVTFISFQTAPAIMTSFTLVGSTTAAFTASPNQILWDFTVASRTSDQSIAPRITSLVFNMAKSSDVTVTDVELTIPGTGVTHSCTVSSSQITCSGIPTSIGAIDDTQRLQLSGDVTLASGAVNPFLQVSLQNSGTATSAGDITWTDGTTTYTWIGLDTPVARGTRFE